MGKREPVPVNLEVGRLAGIRVSDDSSKSSRIEGSHSLRREQQHLQGRRGYDTLDERRIERLRHVAVLLRVVVDVPLKQR